MSGAAALADPVAARLAERLAAFAAFLRANGFAAGPAELADAGRISAARWAGGPAALRPALRALFVRDREEWRRFDPLFDAFFLGGGKVRTRVLAAREGTRARPATLVELAAARADNGRPGRAEAADRRRRVEPRGGPTAHRPVLASPNERRGAADTRALLAGDAGTAIEDLAERIGRQLALRLVRRRKRARRGAALDLAATIRASLERGGWPFDLVRRQPRIRPLRLAFLLDASGSMRPWLPLHLRFVRGLSRLAWVEAHLFHTRLVPVSRALRERDPERAAASLALLAEGVGGGTRIGAALATFDRHHAARALRGRACAIVLSDGYETGPLATLDRALGRLRRRARLLLWLDPLAGAAADRSAVRALALARHRADLVAPAGGPSDLAALERLLTRARGRRPRGPGAGR
ncbi:MAG: VWA domain-containing protein [Geminicoccaceae bacterium]|nr:VWA domain-containing protein [Geminicoccaceae bacterium]